MKPRHQLRLFWLVVAFAVQYSTSEVDIQRGAFKLYRQEQTSSQKNNIKIRFRTIHATGLIMFAQGANKKDYLTLELVRGKIRAAANYGKGQFMGHRGLDQG